MGFQAQLLFWHHSSSISSHGFAWTWTLECLGEKASSLTNWKLMKKWRLFRKESVEFHVVGDLDLKVFLDRSTISRTSRKRVECDGHHERWIVEDLMTFMNMWQLFCWETILLEVISRHFAALGRIHSECWVSRSYSLNVEVVLCPFLLLRNSRLKPKSCGDDHWRECTCQNRRVFFRLDLELNFPDICCNIIFLFSVGLCFGPWSSWWFCWWLVMPFSRKSIR